uniref:Uncharacterized protein n=1 Tax=Lates calcarifer TaxID=8187 RepID=A0A4W6EK66_LATCA
SSRPFLEDPSLVFALSLFTCDSAMSALSSASSSSCCSLRSLAMLVFAASSSSPQLLQLSLDQVVSSFQEGDVLSQVVIAMLCIVQLQLSVLQKCLEALELFLGVSCLPVSLAELNLHLIHVTFHLLLDSQVSLGLLHFLIFLSHFPLHLGLHLVELKLGSQDLTLFMLQRSFCLLQC